ncbi:DUF3027 domain-containing protein [Aeromicrobium phragmitis]|uniref:DUF3027 domain-containing protein n=1 Tax=Aeromicrobium phragmitis TaxID=2478914 RepID=A0A3L8PIA6_9ACTN|nr:DUF3027 domain-containing protein [Aeromicrobium phragmitis]RLV55067.1 DUF3027 domain-containing protein [Aeromicrobium phragmitis]
MSTVTNETARAALDASVDEGAVGDYLGRDDEAPGLVTERFACTLPGYVGWYWAVSLSVLPDAEPTINDIVLLPGETAIVAPEWTPYRERIQPGDLGPGDVLPPEEDDIRLAPAWFAGDGGDEGVVDRHFAREVGLGREWVLSLEGREEAADRWYAGDHGPDAPIAKQAPGRCGSCGFLISLAGDLSDRFGVCGNGMANADGKVVALTHGCGAHSGTRPKRSNSARTLPEPVLDTVSVDDVEEF